MRSNLVDYINDITGDSLGEGPRRCPHPDHDDNHPSFSITGDKFNCSSHSNSGGSGPGDKFGGTGKVSFAMQYFGFGKDEALRHVRDWEERNGVSASKAALAPKSVFDGDEIRIMQDIADSADKAPPAPQTELKSPATPQVLVARACRSYHMDLLSNDRAMDYLDQRGVTGASVEDYRLGFARSEGAVDFINRMGLGEDQYAEGRLHGCGLLAVGKRAYIYFKDRIMFPLEGSRGLAGFTARDITERSQVRYKLSPKNNSLGSASDFLFGLRVASDRINADESRRLTVVEGVIDAIKLDQAGIAAVAVQGKSISAKQMEMIFTLTHRVDFCFDGDDAGRDAMRSLFVRILPTMRDSNDIRFVSLPKGEDPDMLITGGRWVAGESMRDVVIRMCGMCETEEAAAIVGKIRRAGGFKDSMQKAVGERLEDLDADHYMYRRR